MELMCYIEKYTKRGKPRVRLRDKATNKKVSIVIHGPEDKYLLLAFLSQGKRFPSIYDRNGQFAVKVTGILRAETDDKMEVDFWTEGGRLDIWGPW